MPFFDSKLNLRFEGFVNDLTSSTILLLLLLLSLLLTININIIIIMHASNSSIILSFVMIFQRIKKYLYKYNNMSFVGVAEQIQTHINKMNLHFEFMSIFG